MNKILSIVIPSYNSAEFLPIGIPTFTNISPELLEKIEIIIVNDGSKDSTLSVAREFERQYPTVVKVIDKENGGHGSTINAGILEAQGKYFKVVDADDYVDAIEFERLIKFLINTDVDQVITPYVMEYFVENRKEIMDYANVVSETVYTSDEFLTLIGKIPEMHSIVYKTNILRNNDIRLSENCFYVDIQYNLYPLHLISTIAYVDTVVYQYQIGNINQSVSVSSYLKNKAMHDHVIKSVIAYRNDNATLLSEIKKKLMDELITGLVSTHINIYLSMPVINEGQIEYREFMNYLKGNHPYSVDNPFGKKAKLLKYMPFLFPVLAKIYQKKIS